MSQTTCSGLLQTIMGYEDTIDVDVDLDVDVDGVDERRPMPLCPHLEITLLYNKLS